MSLGLNTSWQQRLQAKRRTWSSASALHLDQLAGTFAPRHGRRAVVAIALLFLAQSTVELARVFVPRTPATPAAQSSVEAPAPAEVRAASPPPDVNRLARSNLFGIPGSPAETELAELADLNKRGTGADGYDSSLQGIENDAPETRLPVILAGVLFSDDPGNARAIIEWKQDQGIYALGDDLPLEQKARVAKILADRIVLATDDQYELLLLFEDDERFASAATLAARRDQRAAGSRRHALEQRNQKITQLAEAHRNGVFGDPRSLAQVVNISPVNQNGMVNGYRASAGRDGAVFTALGFRADDVIVAINGSSLSDPGTAMELFRVLQSSKRANFEVLRDGQPITLQVALDKGLQQ